jgi:excisionase family DNA binding protein
MAQPNHRLVKKNRSYSVEETARLFNVHRGTVRMWIKNGLAICDSRRPILILGSQLSEYLRNRRLSRKRPCTAGEIYCVRCRRPQRPAGNIAEYQSRTPNLGVLVGICPSCNRMIHRTVNPHRLGVTRGSLEIVFTAGQPHISEITEPLVNRDLKGRTE